MNSHEIVSICKKCKHRIEAYGFDAFELVCSIYYNQFFQCPVFFNGNDKSTKKYLLPIIKYLESKDILITTEYTKYKSIIQVRIIENYTEFDGETCLCWCEEKDME